MSKIKIKNFGPIKEGCKENDGWIDVKKVTVFIGNQASGKSTVAKTISTLSWLEKSINRGDTDKSKISFHKFKEFFEYQKIHNYFSKTTYIEYLGEKYHILYDTAKEYPIIKEVEGKNYIVPQIMYVPAERNFLSTISDAFGVKGLADNLFNFAEEYRKASMDLNGEKIKLPIGNYSYEYDNDTGISYIIGPGYRINLLEASSGIQSFVPLFIVSRNLSMKINEKDKSVSKVLTVNQAVRLTNEVMELMGDKSLNEIEKNKQVNKIRARYFNKCLFNIFEEPEQNLYPSSQWKMLKSFLEFNNRNKGNKLIMTTHSPYIVNYLTLVVKAGIIKEKISTEELKKKLGKIIPLESTVKPDDLVIYELDEIDGVIKRLEPYNGLPSDENKLNERLEENNELFAQLLEIQQEL